MAKRKASVKKDLLRPAEPEGEPFPSALPVLLLPNQVVFPMAVVPLRVHLPGEVQLVNDAIMGDKFIGLVAMRDSDGDDHSLENAYDVGCIARIMQMQHGTEGGPAVILQALKRFRLRGVVQTAPYPIVKIKTLEPPPTRAKGIEPLTRTVRTQVLRLIRKSPDIPAEAAGVVENIQDPDLLADLVSANLSISVEQRQRLLETVDTRERLDQLTHILAREIEILELSNKIQSSVKSTIDKGQREFFLRQQLKAIHDELGDAGGDKSELTQFEEQLDALALPESIDKEARREIKRLRQMNEASAEYHVILTYLDWFLSLPWKTETEDRLDISFAGRILNEDHHGLEKVKKRILEYLAVRKLKPDAPGPILCFVGPPGVGKTSLGRSIARALNRNFARMSLGGMRDEAEIRGHRRTYVGAMPGRIIQNIRKAESNNPVFMLDEIDKLGADFRGDPSSALLEVLDPAQNNSFSDLYLNVPFDLSKVMFVATANLLDTIPWALRDRMEVIEIPGYTQEEKLAIAEKYLLPRQLDNHGLKKSQLRLTKSALRAVIDGYTREAGVRNLEREIGNVCRGAARQFAGRRRKLISVKPENLKEYLGNEKVHRELVERTAIPGVAIGLAWTAMGGDILFIESTKMPGKGKLTLTGHLGEVMKESAQAALSYIRSNAHALGVEEVDFNALDLHVHVPAGAVPKDGPSAGVTIFTSMTSLLTGRAVRPRVAMTGEITLRGNVLPVGGIKEKVLAANRAGIKELILCHQNAPDLDEVPATVRKKMVFHLVKRMDEVLEKALRK